MRACPGYIDWPCRHCSYANDFDDMLDMKSIFHPRISWQANTAKLLDGFPGHHWSWRVALILITCLAFGFRYYYVLHAQILQPVEQSNARGDAVDYYNYARNLIDHGIFSKSNPSSTEPVRDSYRDPGYPIFLAAWLKISDQSSMWYASVLISQAMLGALTVSFLVQLSRSSLPIRWSLVAGVLMAIWPHSVAMSGYLLTETLAGAICAWALLFLHHAIARCSKSGIFFSGIIFSAAALTNAVIYPFGCVACLWMRWRKVLNTRLTLSLAVGSLALVMPWMLRNSQLPAENSSSSGRALDNLVQGSWPSYQSAYQAAIRHDPRGEIIMSAIDREIAAVHANAMHGMGLIWRRISSHPLEYATWYISKPYLLWGWDIGMGQGDVYVYPTRNSPFATNPLYRAVIAVCHALNGLLFWCAAGGCLLILLASPLSSPGLSATALLLIYTTAIYSVFQVDPRYSVPFRGEEILVATIAVRMAWRWVSRLQLRSAATA